jgi:hypothetical protein
MERELIVERVADLDRLIANPGAFDAVSLNTQALALGEAEATRLGRRLTGWVQECGCGAGGLSALLALIAALPVGAALWTLDLAHPLTLAGAALVAMIASALAAKAIVLSGARRSLRREAARLKARLSSR